MGGQLRTRPSPGNGARLAEAARAWRAGGAGTMPLEENVKLTTALVGTPPPPILPSPRCCWHHATTLRSMQGTRRCPDFGVIRVHEIRSLAAWVEAWSETPGHTHTRG